MKNIKHLINETPFQNHIVEKLLNSGYIIRKNKNFDIQYNIDSELFLSFIKNTQPEEWNKYKLYYWDDSEKTLIKAFYDRFDWKKVSLIQILSNNEFHTKDCSFKLFFRKPNTDKNPDLIKLYEQNILSVIEEVVYEKKASKNKKIDLVIFLNWIPLITIELKKTINQPLSNAEEQYKSRNPDEQIFKKALVHFAMTEHDVLMCTKLEWQNSKFIPFNKDIQNIADEWELYNTSYMYNKIFKKDILVWIISNYILIEDDNEWKKKFIFPRYHQIDAVNKIYNNVNLGERYLIQHSAWSWKTKTIGWLAHMLRQKFTNDGERMFDSIIIISDRNVVDEQLRNQLWFIESANEGVLWFADERASQLKTLMENKTNIIVTTIQKFRYIVSNLNKLKKYNYAIIIDEAHSWQNWENMRATKNAISNTDDNTYTNDIDERNKLIKQNKLANASFFAFTATPTEKILELFGEKNNNFSPFHSYSMEQAEKEWYILNVLNNYHFIKEDYDIIKMIKEDPEVEKWMAKKTISKKINESDDRINKISEFICKQFINKTIYKINGGAKAMVVASSRKSAISYKLKIDDWLIKNWFEHIKTLVAFTWTEEFNGIEYTEKSLNKIKLNIKNQFNKNDYKILIVANKFQTWFDQPLLHTMFIDKSLKDIQLVQTISRLNRIYKWKTDTMVFDFKNNEEVLKNSFQKYYNSEIELNGITDVDKLYELSEEILSYNIVNRIDINNFYLIASKEDVFWLENLNNQFNDRFFKLKENDINNCKKLWMINKKVYKSIFLYITIINIYTKRIFRKIILCL